MNLRTLASAAVVLALSAAAAPASADRPAHRRTVDSVTFTTQGFGHGKGLSQYGARNRANAGQTYAEIVQHYYPGAGWGRASGKLRIRLDADTTRDVVVLPVSGLRAQRVAGRSWRLPSRFKGHRVVRWRIQPVGDQARIQLRVHRWRTWRTVRGEAQFTAERPITLVTSAGRSTYRGVLRATHGRTVNLVGLESYLRGVVPREVPATWPAQAVRAQAVAARTYAVSERADHRARGDFYDLCDTASCQVYGGFGSEHPESNTGVRATAGRILTSNGAPIFAQFSASNGGYSVDGGLPYLRAEPDPMDQGLPGSDPLEVVVPAAKITRNWAGIGDLVSVQVTATDGHGVPGFPDGRATQVRVTGTNFAVTVPADRLRSWLELRSTLFRVS